MKLMFSLVRCASLKRSLSFACDNLSSESARKKWEAKVKDNAISGGANYRSLKLSWLCPFKAGKAIILETSGQGHGAANSDACDRPQNHEVNDVHIVIHVSPCRQDVLRLEEDESRLEDFWTLPGDTTGFKADWSFVQQWRLKG